MQPADLDACELVGLGGTERRLRDAVQNVPVELGGPGLALGFHVLRHESVCQFGHRGRATFGGFLIRRVETVRHRPQDDLGARSGALWRDFPDGRDGVPTDRCAASRARPVNNDIGLRPGGAHSYAEAGDSVIPYGVLAAFGLQDIYRTLADSLRGHGWLALCNRSGSTGAAPKRKLREIRDSSVGAKGLATSGFLSLRES